MERLWAPWRQKYFTDKPKGCFLCAAKRSKKDNQHLIFKRNEHAFGILNLYPYNNGHVMLVPNRHVSDLADLTEEERMDLMNLFVETKQALTRAYKPDGFNAGFNFGQAGGAGLVGHIHWHLLPRWNGDTNFLPILAESKVISESAQKTLLRIKKAFKKRKPK